MAYWDAHEQAARAHQEKVEKIRDKHRNKMNGGQRILFNIALNEDSSYDSEYDGRTYTHCRFCDATLSEGNDHYEGCDIFEARKALGKSWTNYTDELDAERKAKEEREEAKAKADAHKKEKIPCDQCGKKVSRMGMKDHKASPSCQKKQDNDTLRSHEERTGIKCITDIFINYDGKRCKECNKPMPDAHPNAKFCSNKGKGNCKDHYHNRSTPERLERAKHFSGHNAKVRREQQSLYLIASPFQRMMMESQLGIFEEGDPSWDAHKDC